MMMKNLNDKTWIAFPLINQFNKIEAGKGKGFNHLTYNPNGINYIGATNQKNGVLSTVKINKESQNMIQSGNAIGFIKNGNGSAGFAIYKKEKFISTSDVLYGYASWLNTNTGNFFVVAQNMIENKYNHGYKRNLHHLSADKIMLPTTENHEPDYPYMEQYVKLVKEKLINRYKNFLQAQLVLLKHVDIPKLADKKWKKYNVFGQNGILKIETSQSSIDKNKLKEGTSRTLPYITRSNMNNGIATFVSSNNSSYGLNSGKCITIGLDTQTAFWQDTSFVTGQNIQIIEGTNLNKFSAHFIIPLLLKQMKAKFNWGGNGATLTRMKRISILLPIDNNGSPDYQYMEQYVKNLMLKKYQQYLVFLNNSEL